MKIFIYGTGEKAKKIIKWFNMDDICGFVETNPINDSFKGKKIYNPDQLCEQEFDVILVATIYYKEIFKELCNRNIPWNKIIFTEAGELVSNNYELLKDCAPNYYKKLAKNERRRIRINEQDYLDSSPSILGTLVLPFDTYLCDYFRFRTFEMIANLINERHIEGHVAEFGVFRGKFSAVIRKKFPNKKLFLFDSFEGFRPEEANMEIENGYINSDFVNFFKDTSVEIALENIGTNENIIVRKGFFPKTAEGLENEKFAFVSIDVDLGDSIYAGLEWFYPRLSENGIIMLHDYNSYLGCVKEAVDKFEEQTKTRLKMIPIADNNGTLIIMK